MARGRVRKLRSGVIPAPWCGAFPIAALILAGCGSAVRAPVASENALYLQEKGRYEPNVGKNYWVRAAPICSRPGETLGDCFVIGMSAKVRVDGITEGVMDSGGVSYPSHIAYYHLTLDDGRAGYIMASALEAGATDIDPAQAAAECKRRGNPRIGMTAAQVAATCWGKPENVNRTQVAGGIEDQYVYGDGQYVYLRNGIVTSIQTSGTIR